MGRLSRAFLGLVSVLVPGGRRREFRQEWEAELAGDARAGRRSAGHRALRLAGAIPDALALFCQDWNVDVLLHDVRYALRLARRRAGFTAIVVLTLAIGSGANTAIFAVINAVLLRPLPYAAPERLIVVWENDRQNGIPRALVSYGSFGDWTTQSRTFAAFTAYMRGTVNLQAGGEVSRIPIAMVTVTFNDVLGVEPMIGRGFGSADEGAEQDVVLISHSTWRSRFGADPELVGRFVRLNDRPYRVVGVMPRGFHFIDHDIEMWRPHRIRPRAASIRSPGLLTVVGRLRDGFDATQARAEMDAIAAAAEERHPATNRNRGVTLVSIAEQTVGDVRRPLLLVALASGIVLLVGCVNVTNLLLVSGHSRQREFAVRAAAGASRGRLARQLLVEAMIHTALGSTLGIILAYWFARTLGALSSSVLPYAAEITLDARVISFAIAAAACTGLMFAILPALAASRTGRHGELAAGTRSSLAPAARRAAAVLVVAELVMAVALVNGAALALRSFWMLEHVDRGFIEHGLLTGKISIPVDRYFGVAPVNEFYGAVLEQLESIPGVRAAAVVNDLPLDGAAPAWTVMVEGQDRTDAAPTVALRTTSERYFEVMGIELVKGRFYRTAEHQTVVINQALAEQLFPGTDPIGVRIRRGDNSRAPWWTIVGVVGDVRNRALDQGPFPEVYAPMAAAPYTSAAIVLRVDSDAGALTAALKTAVQRVDPAVPVSEIRTMRELVERSALGRRAATVLLTLLGSIAFVLAMVGVYGVVAFGVTERAPEIGVRMALGAPGRDVLLGVLGEGLRLGLLGLSMGGILAAIGGHIGSALLFGVEPTDPLTVSAVALTVLLVTALACYVPARRAATVDPVTVLRQ